MTEQDQEIQLLLAKKLVQALEINDEVAADEIFSEISGSRESALFQEVGRLTRQLHDSMNNFSLDAKMTELTANDIPDAKERLHYVITMTEQAANSTLGVVEDLLPISNDLNEKATELSDKWDRFLAKDMPFQEFKEMSGDITAYFLQTKNDLSSVQTGLTDILMAQSFQDITGQIIKKVITLVEDLEKGMVSLVSISGGQLKKKSKNTDTAELPGPVVPGVDDKSNDVAKKQDDVDDLLSSLGF
ncbi:MAG: protein phosphatase CheZ [Methyloprofundus sp.]|nr:protein phosphatase CheZ [Methyloprofundus sp.]